MSKKLNTLSIFKRLFSSGNQIKPKICIVGAGPAGFYAAQHLVKKLDSPEIDIYERLPVPFGLVRFGVAPDHPEVKNVINTFTKTAENPHVKFIGNVNLGHDISLKQLQDAYHIVLLTYGAETSRVLNIPGETLPNVLSARNIVGWYNGIPWDSNLKIDLSGENVAIFGHGNVALDVARILLTPIDVLRKTDITEHALEKLSTSKVKSVQLIGRRGPLQVAFTIKELREQLKIDSCCTLWNPVDFKGIPDIVPNLARPRKRITELMLKSVQEMKTVKKKKIFKPVFCRSPLHFLGDDKVEGVKLGVNKLEGEDILNQRAVLTDKKEKIKCDLAITSIGYKSVQADENIPFDFKTGLIKNKQFKVDRGLYSSGWLATGPSGVILTTMSNAFGTAEVILSDIEKEKLIIENKPGFEGIKDMLYENNVQPIFWKDWLKIDEYEQKEGQKVGKPREKIIDIKKMREIAS